MALNIKNARVHELAREAARRTGRSQTGAIELALEKLLADHEPDAAVVRRQHRIDLVLSEVDAILTEDLVAGIRDDEAALYDDATGLPA